MYVSPCLLGRRTNIYVYRVQWFRNLRRQWLRMSDGQPVCVGMLQMQVKLLGRYDSNTWVLTSIVERYAWQWIDRPNQLNTGKQDQTSRSATGNNSRPPSIPVSVSHPVPCTLSKTNIKLTSLVFMILQLIQ